MHQISLSDPLLIYNCVLGRFHLRIDWNSRGSDNFLHTAALGVFTLIWYSVFQAHSSQTNNHQLRRGLGSKGSTADYATLRELG